MNLKLTNQVDIGNADFYGFASAQKSIKRALEQAGVTITASADKTLCHIGAHLFEPEADKVNYLWHPHEANKINQGLVDKLNRADHLIASCRHNYNVFKQAGVTRPISICKLGIDTKIFKPSRKPHKAKKFRFLWIGNPIDMRKGWDLAAKAFVAEFKPAEEVELYLKTTGRVTQDLAEIGQNVIFDSRNLALADLLDLYESSHAFLAPSRGDGTNLPALEAMAMKLPVLAPAIGGMKDFIKPSMAIPLEFELVDGHYGIAVKVPQVLLEDLQAKMRVVYENYADYKQLTGRARRYVCRNHSLASMGDRLVNILYN